MIADCRSISTRYSRQRRRTPPAPETHPALGNEDSSGDGLRGPCEAAGDHRGRALPAHPSTPVSPAPLIGCVGSTSCWDGFPACMGCLGNECRLPARTKEPGRPMGTQDPKPRTGVQPPSPVHRRGTPTGRSRAAVLEPSLTRPTTSRARARLETFREQERHGAAQQVRAIRATVATADPRPPPPAPARNAICLPEHRRSWRAGVLTCSLSCVLSGHQANGRLTAQRQLPADMELWLDRESCCVPDPVRRRH
jgi:hypothetical protein